jgi:hypothetical protein
VTLGQLTVPITDQKATLNQLSSEAQEGHDELLIIIIEQTMEIILKFSK